MIRIKRKIIQIANSTQLISLPRKWAILNNIKKGDEIEVEEQGSTLILNSEKRPKREITEIDIKDNKHYIKYILHGFYKKGYDEVLLNYDDPKIISTIQSNLHDELIGFEIVEQKPDCCLIKTVAGAHKDELDPMIRRTFILLKTMSKEVFEALTDINPSNLKNLLHFEITNNKHTSFCRRILNKYGYKESKRITYMYCIVETLENIADEYKHIINCCLNKKYKKKISPAVINIYKELTDLLEDSYDAYYNFEMQQAISIFLRRKELIRKSYEAFSISNGGRLAHHSINIAQKINNLIKFKLEMEL